MHSMGGLIFSPIRKLQMARPYCDNCIIRFVYPEVLQSGTLALPAITNIKSLLIGQVGEIKCGIPKLFLRETGTSLFN